MKKITLIFSGILLLLCSFTMVAHLYTKEKVENLGSSLGGMAAYSYTQSFCLGDLLSLNYGIYAEEHVSYNDQTNELKNSWRDLLASNPSLAYSAFDLYSSDFTLSFKKEFENKKLEQIKNITENPYEGSNEDIISIKKINSDAILKNSVANMKTYQKLIDELLKLDDVKMNSLIKTNEVGYFYPSKDLLIWLESKGYISVDPDFKSYNYSLYYFPMDLIALSNRVSSNYPQWTNRKFLQEAKKFSLHVEKNLKF